MSPQTITRPLVIEEFTGINRDNWPVTGGIPFGEGELWSLDAMRMLDTDGQEVATQVWELCRWQDGSIRWAGVHLEPSVQRQSRHELTLEFGEGVARTEPDPGIAIELDEDEIRVETNALGLCIERAPLRLTGARKDGVTLIEPGEGDGLWVADSEGARYWARVEEVETEIQGPLYAVMRLTGKHVDVAGTPGLEVRATEGRTFMDFMLRVHVFAHAPWVQLDYTFINREDVPDVELGEIVFQASLPPGASQTALCGAYESLYESPEGLMTDLALPVNLTGIYPNAETYTAAGESTGFSAHGWADLSGPDGGVTIAIRDYAENYPKRTVAADRRLQMHFWPGQAGVLKFHQGMAKTHMMMLYLHPGSGKEAEASQIAHGFNERLVFTPQPWYRDTMVFGEVFPFLPGKYPNIERRLRDEFIGWEDCNRALGMLDWGDFPQFGMEGRERFMGNNEHDFMHAVLLQWMRTGERKLLRALDASIYHTLDIDTVHHNTENPDEVGGVRTHADGHWNYGGRHYVSTSHMWAEGLAEYACLFADRRALEGARGICDYIVRLDEKGFRWPGGERTSGWACISLIPTYEATGDQRYLDTARRIIHSSMDQQNEDGSYYTHQLGFHDSKCPMQMTIYATGITYYLRCVEDEEAARCLLRILDWRIQDGCFPDGTNLYVDHWDYRRSRSGGDLREPLGCAYALTGDDKYIRFGMVDHERCFAGFGSQMLNAWAWGINHRLDHICTIMGHAIALDWRGNFRFMYWADKAGLLEDLKSV